MSILSDFTVNGRSVVGEVFFETGLCTAQTLSEAARQPFAELHSVDIYGPYVRAAKEKFSDDPRVRLHHGSSPDVLKRRIDPTRPTTFYLDAHYQGHGNRDESSPRDGECPLMRELKTVFSFRWDEPPVVIVDDLHHLTRPWSEDLRRRFDEAQWPTVEQVLAAAPRGYTVTTQENMLCLVPDSGWFRGGKGHLSAMVPQGVGDVYWSWQMLSQVADTLELVVFAGADPRPGVTHRAAPVVSQLPKVVGVRHETPAEVPTFWAKRRRVLEGVRLDGAWAANKWLEDGVPLGDVDPDVRPRRGPAFAPRRVDGLTPGRYLALYASGDAARHRHLGETVWPPDGYARMAERVFYNAGLGVSMPVVVLGAEYDRDVTEHLVNRLTAKGFSARPLYQLPPQELTWLFANAWGFLGYQSGLNVLCDAAGGRQLCVYFPSLEKMADTWADPRGGGRFEWTYFDNSPEAAAGLVRWPAPA